MTDLTIRQQRWVEAYLTTFNATEAARRAGYGETIQTLRHIGCRNRHNPKIKAVLEARLAEAAMSTNEFLALVASMARGDLQDFLQVEGGVKLDLDKAAQLGKLGLIKKYRADENGVEVELYDRLAALALLAKVMGLFREQVDNSGEVVLRVVYGNEEPSSRNPTGVLREDAETQRSIEVSET